MEIVLAAIVLGVLLALAWSEFRRLSRRKRETKELQAKKAQRNISAEQRVYRETPTYTGMSNPCRTEVKSRAVSRPTAQNTTSDTPAYQADPSLYYPSRMQDTDGKPYEEKPQNIPQAVSFGGGDFRGAGAEGSWAPYPSAATLRDPPRSIPARMTVTQHDAYFHPVSEEMCSRSSYTSPPSDRPTSHSSDSRSSYSSSDNDSSSRSSSADNASSYSSDSSNY